MRTEITQMEWQKVICLRDRIDPSQNVQDTGWEIMTNGSCELFVRFGDKELRLSPERDGFSITDWNSPGKLTLDGRIYVR